MWVTEKKSMRIVKGKRRRKEAERKDWSSVFTTRYKN